MYEEKKYLETSIYRVSTSLSTSQLLSLIKQTDQIYIFKVQVIGDEQQKRPLSYYTESQWYVTQKSKRMNFCTG